MQLDSNELPSEPVPYLPGRTTAWNNRWRDIFQHFGQAILAYAKRSGLNDSSAEDALQEVMTALIRCQHGQAGTGFAVLHSFEALQPSGFTPFGG